jgi:LemA protein
VTLIVVMVIIAVLVIAAIVLYNKLIALRMQAQNAWSDIDVQLKRRADLVPNLVTIVKGYATHERETLDRVTEARTRALAAQQASPAKRAQPEGELSMALRGLAVTVEAYPELQASDGFRDLQAQLASTEDAIQNARRYYNAVVRDFNTAIMTFPALLLARPMGFDGLEFFQADAEDRDLPRVNI